MSENENDTSEKEGWTEAEQAEMDAKCYQEFMDYARQLERQALLEKWGEERLLKELEKHPYLRSKPKNPTELYEIMERVQQLKLSTNYKTPNELAQKYKEDGNIYYKNKKFMQADICFGKGMETECKDKELLAQLNNNRALAFFKMSLYRQSLVYCKQALTIKSDYLKPMHTAAKCCYNINDYDQCIHYCDQILNIGKKNNDANKEIVSLKAKAEKSKASPKTDSTSEDTKEKATRKKILDVIKSRNIKLDESDIFYDSQAIFRIPVNHVHLGAMNLLVWPVILRIVEYDEVFLLYACETKPFSQILKDGLKQPSMEDNKQYQLLGKLNVYFDGVDSKSYRIDIEKSLGEILEQDKFIVRHGTPYFHVVVANNNT